MLWIILALWIGFLLGFCTAAILSVTRDGHPWEDRNG